MSLKRKNKPDNFVSRRYTFSVQKGPVLEELERIRVLCCEFYNAALEQQKLSHFLNEEDFWREYKATRDSLVEGGVISAFNEKGEYKGFSEEERKLIYSDMLYDPKPVPTIAALILRKRKALEQKKLFTEVEVEEVAFSEESPPCFLSDYPTLGKLNFQGQQIKIVREFVPDYKTISFDLLSDVLDRIEQAMKSVKAVQGRNVDRLELYRKNGSVKALESLEKEELPRYKRLSNYPGFTFTKLRIPSRESVRSFNASLVPQGEEGSTINLQEDRTFWVKLSKCAPLLKLRGHFPNDDCVVRQLTLSRLNGEKATFTKKGPEIRRVGGGPSSQPKWVASIVVERPSKVKAPSTTRPVVIRLDLLDFFGEVDGKELPNFHALPFKHGPRGAKNKLRRKQNAIRRRNHAMHMYTTKLAEKYSNIVLHVPEFKAITRSGKGNEDNWGANVELKKLFNRLISQRGMGLFKQLLEYKCAERGTTFTVIEDEHQLDFGNALVNMAKAIRKEKRALKIFEPNEIPVDRKTLLGYKEASPEEKEQLVLSQQSTFMAAFYERVNRA